MEPFTSKEIVIGVLYGTGALLLLITAYVLFIRKKNRGKLEAMNDLKFETSRSNVFVSKTQFLLTLAQFEHVRIEVLSIDESPVKLLLDKELPQGQHIIDFDPSDFEEGKYYLSLRTENTNILRKITISK